MKAELISLHGGHSGQFCCHARDRLEDIVRQYIRLGFSRVGITEHVPPAEDRFLYPDEIEQGFCASDLLERFWDMGFSEDQKHRLNDLYELRKDHLKREKLSEIDSVLESIRDSQELKDYWDSIKWYLQSNRRFCGKEFENIIAKKFDEAGRRIEG